MSVHGYRPALRGIIISFVFVALISGTASAKSCLDCHSSIIGARANVAGAMKSGSHHVQGTQLTNKHCYACHWEATADGGVNDRYHSGNKKKKTAKAKNAKINLVIWADGQRPKIYKLYSTAVEFEASSIGTPRERGEISLITRHCLGCHNDQNNETRPFTGDVRTPRTYAWDGQSVASRYSNGGFTTWGKYSTASTNKKKRIAKSFSAHGNAAQNMGGWSASSGYDGDMPVTRGGNGARNVECYDCHNSHGTSVSGVTSSYRTFDGTNSGGILKETSAGTGGYRMSYKPSVNSDLTSKNPFNAGAGLCFDCHETAKSGLMPWGYSSTYGTEQPIMGYKDTLRFGPGSKGSTTRYANRQSRTDIVSSHLKAGLFLNYSTQGKIGGLCTPCHDPHGLSRTLGGRMPYAVPLLKGTWLTSPYQEDVPPAVTPGKGALAKRGSNTAGGVLGGGSAREPMSMPGMKYNVDRNTFASGERIVENADTFGGLCIGCHSEIKPGEGSKTGQLHRAVKGWGANKEHAFPCSKCHQPHNSGLPRLMQTNCFEQGPSGLRENSGLSWIPDKKDDKTARDQDSQQSSANTLKNKKSGKGELVGCHVRQFGKR
jgi:hypothetical protein